MGIGNLNIEDIKADGVVEITIARSSGKIRRALIVKTDIFTKSVSFIVLSKDEEKEFDSIEEAVNNYNLVQ